MSKLANTACRSCLGGGKLTVSTQPPITIACRVCNGAGYGEYVEVACSSCQGARGFPCARCSGSGRVTTFRPASN